MHPAACVSLIVGFICGEMWRPVSGSGDVGMAVAIVDVKRVARNVNMRNANNMVNVTKLFWIIVTDELSFRPL